MAEVYAGYRVGDRVRYKAANSTKEGWRGVVVQLGTCRRDGQIARWAEVAWSGVDSKGRSFEDEKIGMEFFEIYLDPDFMDVPPARDAATVERWLAS